MTQGAGTTARPTSIPTSGHEMPRPCEPMRMFHAVRLPRAIAATNSSNRRSGGGSVCEDHTRATDHATAIPARTTTRLISSRSRLSVTSSWELGSRATSPPLRAVGTSRPAISVLRSGILCTCLSSLVPVRSTHGALLRSIQRPARASIDPGRTSPPVCDRDGEHAMTVLVTLVQVSVYLRSISQN